MKITNSHIPKIILLIIILFISSTAENQLAYSSTIYVDIKLGKDFQGDGISWQTAYTDLSAALLSAVAGDEVWVASGTYIPTIPSWGGSPSTSDTARSEDTFALLVPNLGVLTSFFGGFTPTPAGGPRTLNSLSVFLRP